MRAFAIILALSGNIADACPPHEYGGAAKFRDIPIRDGKTTDLQFDTTIKISDRPMADPYASAAMNAFDQALWNVLVLPYSVHCGAPWGPCFYAAPLNAAMIVVDVVTRGPTRIIHP